MPQLPEVSQRRRWKSTLDAHLVWTNVGSDHANALSFSPKYVVENTNAADILAALASL
jgi:hypothetical protein